MLDSVSPGVMGVFASENVLAYSETLPGARRSVIDSNSTRLSCTLNKVL